MSILGFRRECLNFRNKDQNKKSLPLRKEKWFLVKNALKLIIFDHFYFFVFK